MTDPRPTSAFHSANRDPAVTARLVTALDVQAANPGVRRLRAWAHDRLAARPGERALDVGAGTGSETQVLAAAVAPEGDAIGIEPHPGLRAVAEQRAAEAGSRARFLDGDALALPLPDGESDVVWCERVLQHLTDPARAVAEMARVLRPGGRIALLDTDWSTFVLHPTAPEIRPALATVVQGTAAQPDAGRSLAGRLVEAGLTVDHLGGDVLLHDSHAVARPIVRGLGAAAVGRGLITEEQRDRLYAGLDAAAEAGTFHLSVTMFAAVAHRPR
ncbi:methyltransferase domain-containing protein [Streptomyces sp. CBMA156]|uniref:methyltransferase domain-containing protein n=1 Tax=Streptomyces sp. CBMA156 TaxID=1930280 RepID=UPI001661E217|nr:methyltransferase domain-containing protein [Streptomyces sp. CBMA156]MBD0674364.1 SAM-dependent methyltransferase [Streptomyces sp. CBMA156]